MEPTPRQTLSYLKHLFQAHGLEAKSKLGQNYLIDLNLIDLIVREAIAWGLRMAGFLAGLGVLLFVLSSYPDWWPAVMFPVLIGMAIYYAWNSPWYRRLREQKASEKEVAAGVKAK